MKMLCSLVVILFVVISSCNTQSQKEEGFVIHRGLNASHWLSQSEKRGEERAEYMQEKDFAKIAELGFDHVRLPIDEVQMWDEEGNKINEAWQLLHNGITWSLDNNLRVIVDLHVLRSHHFNNPNNRQLWEDKTAQENFITFWRQLSEELKQYPNDKLAYEPLNEAVSNNPEDWNNLINWVISEIRTLEPERTIILGSNNWQTVGTFKDLKVPEEDKNIILSFHYYEPFLLTHYQAPWTNLRNLTVQINYPGQMVDTTLYSNLAEEELKLVTARNGYNDRSTLDKDIYQAVRVAEKYSLKLYCGEFGCFPTTDIKFRQAWYEDMIAIFDKYDIAWAHWNYKNDFPVVNAETLEPIAELTSILVNR
ncbi:glycoside hydrolase family 5 protein [candidate division KSB1 bacterium]|nr:cellulase family glycosylhydrolase [candidate division KSB1 bacterium]RQW07199.1 MAG: glycoside hydrolase family 5 protein [candidate division KSB1 bacterium]